MSTTTGPDPGVGSPGVTEPEQWVLEQWVIYDHPSDHPEHWVVRRWLIGGGRIAADPGVWLRPTLGQAREVIAANYPDGHRLDRDPGDDPVITEVWI